MRCWRAQKPPSSSFVAAILRSNCYLAFLKNLRLDLSLVCSGKPAAHLFNVVSVVVAAANAAASSTAVGGCSRWSQ